MIHEYILHCNDFTLLGIIPVARICIERGLDYRVLYAHSHINLFLKLNPIGANVLNVVHGAFSGLCLHPDQEACPSSGHPSLGQARVPFVMSHQPSTLLFRKGKLQSFELPVYPVYTYQLVNLTFQHFISGFWPNFLICITYMRLDPFKVSCEYVECPNERQISFKRTLNEGDPILGGCLRACCAPLDPSLWVG